MDLNLIFLIFLRLYYGEIFPLVIRNIWSYDGREFRILGTISLHHILLFELSSNLSRLNSSSKRPRDLLFSSSIVITVGLKPRTPASQQYSLALLFGASPWMAAG